MLYEVITNVVKACPVNFDDLVRMLTIVGSLFGGSLTMQQEIVREKETLNELKSYYKAEVLNEHSFENIVGRSTKMQQIFSLIDTVSPTDATILVRGETGTGKELIANYTFDRFVVGASNRLAHAASLRNNFV